MHIKVSRKNQEQRDIWWISR